MPSPRHDSVVFTVVVSVVAGLAAIPMAIVMALSGEPVGLVVATMFALVPVPPLLACYLWLDRYEPEPKSLLASGLAWGAFVATLLAILVQGIGGWFAGWTEAQSLTLVAPFSEEATKGLFLLLLVVWRRHEFDGVLDGIVYAGVVGIGFAFTENILYLAAAWDGTTGSGGITGVGTLFILRCLASPFAHPLFTTFIGIGLGLAVSSRSTWVRILGPAVGYLLAVSLHAAWNGSTLVADGAGFLIGYVLVMVPIFISMVILAVFIRSRERPLLLTALDDAARLGLIPPADLPHVVDLAARRRARTFARTHGGAAGLRAMRDYQQAAIELGYLHHRVLRGTAPDNYRERGQRFVERMHLVRPLIAFPHQVPTPMPIRAGERHR